MDKMIPKNLNELHILNRKYEYILSNGRNYYEYFNPHERQKIACRFRNSSYNFVVYCGVTIRRNLITDKLTDNDFDKVQRQNEKVKNEILKYKLDSLRKIYDL